MRVAARPAKSAERASAALRECGDEFVEWTGENVGHAAENAQENMLALGQSSKDLSIVPRSSHTQ